MLKFKNVSNIVFNGCSCDNDTYGKQVAGYFAEVYQQNLPFDPQMKLVSLPHPEFNVYVSSITPELVDQCV
jgi:hypothetical protein